MRIQTMILLFISKRKSIIVTAIILSMFSKIGVYSFFEISFKK